MQSTALSQSTAPSLTRALSRLSSKILSTDPRSRLRFSAHERAKTASNLEWARTLLLRAEHETASQKSAARKHAQQEMLTRQRVLIKQLNDRLFELEQLDDGRWGSDDEELDSGDVDELLRAVIEDVKPITPIVAATPKSPGMGRDAEKTPTHTRSMAEERRELLGSKDTTTSGLRARGRNANGNANGTDAASSTGLSVPGMKSADGSGNKTSTALESADVLHADLTSSLVELATQLKMSAQSFSDDLAADAQQLGSTEDALGKNKSGLDSATQRMGVLRRMSEGRWWWGRMMLYAGIGVLWVLLILLVFVGPKIRF